MRNPFATAVSDGLWTEAPKHAGFFRRYVLGQPLGALGLRTDRRGLRRLVARALHRAL